MKSRGTGKGQNSFSKVKKKHIRLEKIIVYSMFVNN